MQHHKRHRTNSTTFLQTRPHRLRRPTTRYGMRPSLRLRNTPVCSVLLFRALPAYLTMPRFHHRRACRPSLPTENRTCELNGNRKASCLLLHLRTLAAPRSFWAGSPFTWKASIYRGRPQPVAPRHLPPQCLLRRQPCGPFRSSVKRQSGLATPLAREPLTAQREKCQPPVLAGGAVSAASALAAGMAQATRCRGSSTRER